LSNLQATDCCKKSLTFVVKGLLKVRRRVKGDETEEDIQRICRRIISRILENAVDLADDSRDCSSRVYRVHEFEIVPISQLERSSRLVGRIPNFETELLSSFPKEVFRTVLVLVDFDQGLCDRVDGDCDRIGEHARSFILLRCDFTVTSSSLCLLTANATQQEMKVYLPDAP